MLRVVRVGDICVLVTYPDFVAIVLSNQNLSELLPFLSPLTANSVIQATLEGLLPTIGLAVLMSFLPPIIRGVHCSSFVSFST